MAVKRGLGRGLESIFADNYSPVEKVVTATAKKDGIQTIRISEIEPKNDQPRKYFDTESLEALADSISQHGFICGDTHNNRTPIRKNIENFICSLYCYSVQLHLNIHHQPAAENDLSFPSDEHERYNTAETAPPLFLFH